jgi:aspartyl-tRNA(Asn)/glutamyl-tRNA(Gln) amidotransferase subunit B
MNRGAVERAIRFGLAVGAKVAPLSIFARKNYFYPDLPKGYQISQYEIPVVQGGSIELPAGRRSARRAPDPRPPRGRRRQEPARGLCRPDRHRPEPRRHAAARDRLRARHALSAEAVEYAKALHALVVWLGICDGNMQEGSFRCDANVSVRKPGAPFGTRREIKNLNSLPLHAAGHRLRGAVADRPIEDGLPIQQATVLFNPDTGETRAMRTKEDAHDYRYFPDPDLPPLVIAPEWIERVRGEMPELPAADGRRFQA